MALTLSQYAELYEIALKKSKTQHDLTIALRENRFAFISLLVIEELKLPIDVREQDKTHSFMVIKYPNSGLYDPFLAFAIKLNGQESDNVEVYFNGRHYKTLVAPIWRKKANFRKPKKNMIFPAELTYDQRALLRKEHMSLQTKKNLKLKKEPSDLYKKWWHKVTFVIKPV
jgi:hypothetical protein